MDAKELDRVEALFLRFHERFAPLFGRRETREQSEQYLRGLLVQRDERRSAENLAERSRARRRARCSCSSAMRPGPRKP